jgi:putative flippase GtrA
LHKFTLFILTSILSFLLNNAINFLLVKHFEISTNLSALFSYFILFFFNFYIFKKFIFTQKNGCDKKLSLPIYIKVNITLRFFEYLSYITLIKLYNYNFLIILNLVSLSFTLIKFLCLRKVT